jgi:hypothetical protein
MVIHVGEHTNTLLSDIFVKVRIAYLIQVVMSVRPYVAPSILMVFLPGHFNVADLPSHTFFAMPRPRQSKYPENWLYGDPCRGTHKYLAVRYICKGKNNIRYIRVGVYRYKFHVLYMLCM